MERRRTALLGVALLAAAGCGGNDDAASVHIANLHRQTDCEGTYASVELSVDNPEITLGSNGEFQARLTGELPANESVQFKWKICPSNNLPLDTKVKDPDGNNIYLLLTGPMLLIQRQPGTGDVHPAATFEIIPKSPQHKAANSVWMVKGGIVAPLTIKETDTGNVVVLPHRNSAAAQRQKAKDAAGSTLASSAGVAVSRATQDSGLNLDLDLGADLNDLGLGGTKDKSTTQNTKKEKEDKGFFGKIKDFAGQLNHGLSSALGGVGNLVNEVVGKFTDDPKTLDFITERVLPAALNAGLGITFIRSGNTIAGASSLTQALGTLLNNQKGVDKAVNKVGEGVDNVCKTVGQSLDKATPGIINTTCRDRGIIVTIKQNPESTKVQETVFTLCENMFKGIKEKDTSGMFAGIADNMCTSYSQSVDQTCKEMILKLKSDKGTPPEYSGSQTSFADKCPPASSFTNMITGGGTT